MATSRTRAKPAAAKLTAEPAPTEQQIIEATEDAQTAIDAAMGRQYAALKQMRLDADGREWTAEEKRRITAIYEEIEVLNRSYAEAGLTMAIALNNSAAVGRLKQTIDTTIDEIKTKQARLEKIAQGLSKAAVAVNMLSQLVGLLAKLAAV
jgi:uncharacterized Rmd1/YagE family protein